MGRKLIVGLALLGLLSAVGCGEENPVSVGGDILGEGFRTFEVVLDASEFLQADTTYDRLGSIYDVPFALAAESFAGELSAHTVFRVQVPNQVTFEDEAGEEVTEENFTIVGGRVTLVLDTLRVAEGPVDFEVLEVSESWDPGTVTWTERFDTAGVSAEWTEPGGTTGQVLGSTRWTEGDTVTIPLSGDVAALTEEDALDRGALLRSTTPNTRIRIQSMQFEFRVRPEGHPSVVGAGSIGRRVIVVTPELASEPDPTELRVGGVPLWRSALQFRPLSEMEIPCEPGTFGDPTCRRRLADVSISQASILLQPLAVGGRRIERPFRTEARAVLRAPGVPVNRSPLSTPLGTMADSIAPALFEPGAEPDRIAVPVTSYLRRNLNPRGDEDPILWVALLARAEQEAPVFGYASFGSIASAAPPQLRIIVTVPLEEDLP